MKVLIGPSNSGKTTHVISRAVEAITAGRGRVRLIVPSANAASVMQNRLMASEQLRFVTKPEQVITTFPGLYNSILSSPWNKLSWLNAIERNRLLRQVISGLAEACKLVYYKETAEMPGLVSAVAEFIDELSRSGTTPAEFTGIAQKRSPKDRDLALIYENYFNVLASTKAVDAESAGLRAAQALEDAGRHFGSPVINGSVSRGFQKNDYSFIAADGFDFFTPVQVRLLSALAARGVEVIATLTYEEGRAVHLWQERTVERLKNARADVVHLTCKQLSEIEQVAAQLMADDPAGIRVANADSIRIISAPDRAAEVRAIAREVKRLVIERGFAVNDFSIVCRSLSQYSHHLERVFRECSIPLALDCAHALAENPLVVAVEKLLSLHANAFSRRACIDCLRSPYFDLSHYGLDESAVNLLDRISLSGNVTREREQWLEAIAAAGQRKNQKNRETDEEEEAATPEERAARYDRMAASVRALISEFTPAATATRGEYAHWILGLLETLCVKERAENGESSTRDLAAFESLEALIGIIGSDRGSLTPQASNASKERSISWRYFFRELEQAIAADSFQRQNAAGLAVIAQEAHNLRPRSFRAVFILGLVEGEFPARASESAPYTQFEREELLCAGIDLTETPADAGADLTQFYKAMNRAAERLYLSHPRTDVNGGELLASYLVDEVRVVAQAREVRIAQSAAMTAQSFSENIASLEEMASLTAYAMRDYFDLEHSSLNFLDEQTRAANALLESRLPSWRATKRGAQLEHARMKGRGWKTLDGIIREASLMNRLREMFGPEHLWSASKINDFGTCPFRFYAKHVLKLAPAIEPFDGFGANELGNAYHKILESLHHELVTNEIKITTDTAQKAASIADQVSEDVLESMASTGSIRKGAMWEFDKSEIKRRVKMLLHAEAEWNDEQAATPIHFERRFGEEGVPPLVIECEDGAVKLRGIIDRIDEREDGWVVIDYKTGRTAIKHAEALDGRNLQLPIYAMAASRVIGKGAKIASAYYLHIHGRKKGSELPHKDDERLSLESIIAHAEERIRDYVSRACAGSFPVKPNNDRCPTYCEFDVMCRIQSLAPSRVESK
jgi:ATP-dependent helicase/nuclease subunit B